jgi:hypothetical protein
VPYSIPILVSSLDDDNEDENPPPPSHLPLDESIEHEPTLYHHSRWSAQHEKQLVTLSVILEISVEHVHSSSKPLLFWLKFHRLVI